ncbi:MAG: tryptophan synthase subunit alpha [Desulfuromonas sp.]|nr:MAG: tryptophan synthase subunit alpha [Desulfuromonas sp.]
MGRIEERFAHLLQQGEAALIPFITAGDPDLGTTVKILHELVEAGADLIELGIPFSDPMADGPTIQAASERALANGATLAGVLDCVRQLREHSNVPVVLMGYYNPVLHYGAAQFSHDAAAAGVDGLLLVDLPPEEAGEIQEDLRRSGIALITLLAPTTPRERATKLAAVGEGYLYYVSMTGVTGAKQVDAAGIVDEVEALRPLAAVPVAVGFGITTPADAAAVADFADGVVVGSALVKIIAEYADSPELLDQVGGFIRKLKEATRRSSQ